MQGWVLGIWLLCVLGGGGCREKGCPNEQLLRNPQWHQLTTLGKMTIPQKRWLHRTNHPNKFRKYAATYTGFELDVNINVKENYFEVYHHPEKPSGIDFREYLAMPEAADKYFWLDCKNLGTDNVAVAITILNTLDSVYQIRRRLIFESTDQEALTLVRKAGYNTVFYLALPALTGSCDDTAYLQRISKNWDHQLLAVSAEAQYIPLLHRYMPAVKKATWCNHPLRNLIWREKRKMLADTSVLIVLEAK